MKTYKKVMIIVMTLYMILYPILPTYGTKSGDSILLALIIIQFSGILLIKEERQNVCKDIRNIKKDKIFMALIALNIIMYLSAIFAIDKVNTIKNSIRFSMYIFMFYMVSYKIDNKYRSTLIINSFILSAFITGICTLYQIYQVTSLGYSIDNTVRMTSFLENSNNLGVYSILAFFLSLMLCINTKEKWKKGLYGVTTILLIVNIIFSQSRNALLGLILGVFVLAILYDKRILLLALLLPIMLIVIPESRMRIIQIFDMNQNSSRLGIWSIAGKIIKDNPLKGIGYENFQYAYSQYIEKYPQFKFEDGYVALHPHNIFLKFQAELGIVGLLIFCVFLFFTLKMLFGFINKTKDKMMKGIVTAIFVALVTFIAMNLIDCYFGAPKVIMSMLLLIAIANNYDKVQKNITY